MSTEELVDWVVKGYPLSGEDRKRILGARYEQVQKIVINKYYNK